MPTLVSSLPGFAAHGNGHGVLAEIILVGILVADPELCISPTGAAIASFTVVANDGRYDPGTGEWVDKGVTFLCCSIGCQAAENVAESLTKGARVLVTGVLRQREWEAADGDKRYAYEVDATEVGVSLKWATVKSPKSPATPPVAAARTGGPRQAPVVTPPEFASPGGAAHP